MGRQSAFTKLTNQELFEIVKKGDFENRLHEKATRLLRKREKEGKLTKEEQQKKKKIIKKLLQKAAQIRVKETDTHEQFLKENITKKEIEYLYYEIGQSDKILEYIENKYKRTFGWTTFKKHIIELDLLHLTKYLRNTKKYYIANRTLIKNQTSEGAYLLGYIVGDGCVHRDSKTVSISSVNLEILEKIQKVLKSEYAPKKQNHKRAKAHWQQLWQLNIRDPLIYENIKDHGIVSNKSQVGCQFDFTKLTEEQYPHFIRGLFDSDGSIAQSKLTKGGNGFYLNLLADRSIILHLQKFLKEKLNLKAGGSYHQEKYGHNLLALTYSVLDAQKIFEYIYKDKGNLFLARKFEKYQELLIKQQNWQPDYSSRRKLEYWNYTEEEILNALKQSSSIFAADKLLTKNSQLTHQTSKLKDHLKNRFKGRMEIIEKIKKKQRKLRTKI